MEADEIVSNMLIGSLIKQFVFYLTRWIVLAREFAERSFFVEGVPVTQISVVFISEYTE